MLGWVVSADPAEAACSGPAAASGTHLLDAATKRLRICVGSSWQVLMVRNVDGTIGLPDDQRACDPSIEGVLRWNEAASRHEGCNGTAWVAFGRLVDLAPNGLDFTTLSGQLTSTLVTSNVDTVVGLDAPVSARLSGDGAPEMSVNGGAWTTSATIEDGDAIQLRLTTSSSHSTTSVATLSHGTTSLTWSVSTGAPCSPGTQTYSTAGSYSFYVPAGCSSVEVRIWGGGGGGGYGVAQTSVGSNGGSGGGGGGYAAATLAVTPGDLLYVTVGAGGAPGDYGNAGGTSSLSHEGTPVMSAFGGGGGIGYHYGTGGGAGGGASGGDVQRNGGNGGTAYYQSGSALDVSGAAGGEGGGPASAGAGGIGPTPPQPYYYCPSQTASGSGGGAGGPGGCATNTDSNGRWPGGGGGGTSAGRRGQAGISYGATGGAVLTW